MPASTHLAHDWPSTTLPVSMGAGVSEQGVGVSTTGVSATGASVTGVSVTGATVALALGLLELVAMASTFICDSQQDSLGVTWGCLGNGSPARWGHLWRWPC